MAKIKTIYKKYSYPRTATAGIVKSAPNRNTAPGRTSNVAEYTLVYIGTYIKGIRISTIPTTELSLPENVQYPKKILFRMYHTLDF